MNEPSNPRTWLITGSSSGFGLALASAVLASNESVIATSRHLETLQILAEQYPETCRLIALDVTDSNQVKNAIAEGVAAFGRIDVVVNNAGYGLVGAFEELASEQITDNFNTNFFGALEVIRGVLPILRAQKSGHLVNMSAAAVIANYPGFSIYGASKWALEGLSESLAIELKPLGIRVTIVQPGPFRTNFIGESLQCAENHISDYDRTSGKFLQFLKKMEGQQPGDPAKAVQAIIAVVNAERPPLRLVLGKYANEKAQKSIITAENERAKWASIGLPTDFTSENEDGGS